MGFGDRIREARKASKLTGEELGRRLGMSKAGISHWENNRYEPSIEQLRALCDALEVSADWMLGRQEFQLSAEALKEARAFDALSPEDKRRWKTMRLTMFSAAHN